ncbi:MAG: glycosyltransferase [Candidatus Wenzhouxiangella sp. M2_3B_020]
MLPNQAVGFTMRVLHIGKFFAPFAGGMENFLLDLMRAADRSGVEQAALVHESPGGHGRNVGEAPFDFLEALERVPMMAQIAYAPISPRFGRALEGLVERFRPDLLHLHLPNTSAFWALRIRNAQQIPWIVHWHSDVVGPGLDTKLKLLYPVYRPLEQAVLRRASRIIATSQPYMDSSRALEPWRDKCQVIPLGLDESRTSETAADNVVPGWSRSDRLKLLAVGRLSRYKGTEVLIEAVNAVPETELIVVGEGERRHRLESVVGDRAGERIRLVGALPDADRNRLLHSCDVLCLSSINRAEAFGMVLLEAMAAGRPVIVANVPGSGMGWVVDHGRTGWLTEPGDVTDLADRLRILAEDRAEIEKAGRRGRERFEQRFRIEAVAEQVVSVYGEVLGKAS